MAEELLDESRLRHEGYFKPEPIAKSGWNICLENEIGNTTFGMLMFQAWLELELSLEAKSSHCVQYSKESYNFRSGLIALF